MPNTPESLAHPKTRVEKARGIVTEAKALRAEIKALNERSKPINIRAEASKCATPDGDGLNCRRQRPPRPHCEPCQVRQAILAEADPLNAERRAAKRRLVELGEQALALLIGAGK